MSYYEDFEGHSTKNDPLIAPIDLRALGCILLVAAGVIYALVQFQF